MLAFSITGRLFPSFSHRIPRKLGGLAEEKAASSSAICSDVSVDGLQAGFERHDMTRVDHWWGVRGALTPLASPPDPSGHPAGLRQPSAGGVSATRSQQIAANWPLTTR